MITFSIVDTARLLTGHRQHRQYRPGDSGSEGPLRTARQERADDADGADAKAGLSGDHSVQRNTEKLNLGTGKGTSIRSVISTVERVTGHSVPVVHAARRPGDPPVLVADASLAHELIGFDPRCSDTDAIVATAWQARMRWRLSKE